MSKRNATIGAAIGFGGMAACVVLAVLNANGPAIRAWLLQTLTPEFGMGVVFTLASLAVAALVWLAEDFIRNRKQLRK